MITRDSTTRVSLALNTVTFLISLFVFLTVCVYIGQAYAALFLVLVLCAAYCEWRTCFLPRLALTILSFGVIGLYVYRIRLTDLAPQTVETLLLLLAIKLLEKKKFRDYMQIYVISVLLLAGSALLGMSLLFLSYVIVLVFLFNTAMVLAAYHYENQEMVLTIRAIEKIVWKASLIPLCAIPLGALIFVVTPRTPYPLLNFLNHGNRSTTGFSDQVRLGKVSDIQEDDSAIFRASMAKISENALYWRGIVLDHFDGTTWKSAHKRVASPRTDKTSPPSTLVWHEIYIEPYGNTYLFALDRPSILLYRSVREYEDWSYSSDELATRKIRYRVASDVNPLRAEESAEAKQYLQLPDTFPRSVKDLANRLRSAGDREETLSSILRFLNSKDFSYSLTNLPVSTTPLEDFLFRQKSGNCEYFASAFAVLARTNGIPARLVAGYHGGLYSDLGRYYLVSQKEAHVWVEAYLPGRGWARYDPTPLSRGPQRDRTGILLRTRLYLDMVNYYWVAFVVNYDVQKQFTLFMRAGTAVGEGGSWITKIPVKTYLIILFCAVCLCIAITSIRRSLGKSNAEKLSTLLLRRLEKRGYRKNPSQGLEEFVNGIGDDRLREGAQRIVRTFEATYYMDGAFSTDETKKLKQQIRRLEASSDNV